MEEILKLFLHAVLEIVFNLPGYVIVSGLNLKAAADHSDGAVFLVSLIFWGVFGLAIWLLVTLLLSAAPTHFILQPMYSMHIEQAEYCLRRQCLTNKQLNQAQNFHDQSR